MSGGDERQRSATRGPVALRPLRIGELDIWPPLVLAPMAGITSWPFRLMCRRCGAGLVCGEMLSAEGLFYANRRTHQMLTVKPEEKPVSLQILAARGDRAEHAARMLVDAGADIVDINFGCFVPKVRKTGGGCLLMADLARAREVIEGVLAGAGGRPVTVKLRSGVDEEHKNALEVAQLAQELGVAAVVLHPRTGRQLFSGRANWGEIAKLKAALDIPVIGSGDVRTPEDAAQMLRETGCDGVMVGRGALGDPWIFQRIAAYLMRGEELRPPGPEERLNAALALARDLVEYAGERSGILQSRKHLAWFSKGLPGSAEFRRRAHAVTSLAEAERVICEYLESLKVAER